MMNPLSNLPAPQPSEPRPAASGTPAASVHKSFEHMLSSEPNSKPGNAQLRENERAAKSAASRPRAAGVSGKQGATQTRIGESDTKLSMSRKQEEDAAARLKDSLEALDEVDREQHLGDPTLEALLIGIPLSVPQPKPEPATVSWNESGTAGEDAGSLSLNDGLVGQESSGLSPRGNQNREEQPTAQFFQQPLGLNLESPAQGGSQAVSALPLEAQTVQTSAGPSDAMSYPQGSPAWPRGIASVPGQIDPSQLLNASQPVPEGMLLQAAELTPPLSQTAIEAGSAGQTIQQALAQAMPWVQESPQTSSQEAASLTPESGTARWGTVSAASKKPLFQAGLGKPSDAEEALRFQDSIPEIRALGKDAQPPGAEEEETVQQDALQAARKPVGMASAMQESAMQKPASNRSNSSKAAAFAASENSAPSGTEFFPQATAFPGQPVGPGLQSAGKAAAVSRQEMTSIVNHAVDAAQQIKATGPESVEVKLQLESGETLSIQLQLTRGEVKPVFRAESESLRVALEQNWAQFSNRAEERGVRLASAVFESQPSSLGMNDQPGRQSGRERGEPTDPQENFSSQTPLRRNPSVAKSTTALRPSANVQLYA